MKLNLGSGKKYMDGYINVDLNPNWKSEKRFDVKKVPYPLKDNIVDEIVAYHILEHFTPTEFYLWLNEIQRICKKGAIVNIKVPFYNSSLFKTGFDHRLPFNYVTFDKLANVINKTIIINTENGFKEIERKCDYYVLGMKAKPTRFGKFIPEMFGFRRIVSHILCDVVSELTFILIINENK